MDTFLFVQSAALDLHLFWLAVAFCALVLGQALTTRGPRSRGVMLVCGGILGLAVASHLLLPAQSETIVVAAWLAFLIFPLILQRIIARFIMKERYVAARRLASVARLFYPFDGAWSQPVILEALAAARQGETGQAAAILSRLENDPRVARASRNAARAHRLRLTGNWAGVLEGETPEQAADPALLNLRVRALGECGRLREMIDAASRASAAVKAANFGLDQLYLLAFCGRRKTLEALLNGPLAALEPDTRTIWLATASLAAGDPHGQGRAEMIALTKDAANPLVRDVARSRLDHPPANALAQLETRDWAIIDELEARFVSDAPFRPRLWTEWRSAYVIIAMVVLNLAAFAAELDQGGAESWEAIYELGGMWPQSVVERGEVWRLLASTFLHYGYAHLILNMLALAVLGVEVERWLGHGRTLVLYLVSGVGSSTAVLLLSLGGWMDERMLVGASGAIFGLVGAQLVMFIDGWRRAGSPMAARRLINIAMIVLLQVAFDMAAPEVSMTAHVSGFLVGAAMAAALRRAA